MLHNREKGRKTIKYNKKNQLLLYLSHNSNESNLTNIATLSAHVGSSNYLAMLSVSMQVCVIWDKIVLKNTIQNLVKLDSQ